MIGLELSFERLMRMRRVLFGLGAAQVLVSAVLIAGIAYALGLDTGAAIVLGGALALSSTAIVIPVLAETQAARTPPTGRATFAILLFQDLCVAPLLILVGALGRGAGAGAGLELIATLAVAARRDRASSSSPAGWCCARLFQMVAVAGSTEFFMAACLLVVMGTALITAASGLSMAIGAFIAGLLLAETEYRREIEVMIEPFQGLLLGLFFVSVGVGPRSLTPLRAPGPRSSRSRSASSPSRRSSSSSRPEPSSSPWPVAREMALLLGPGGEFAFVMLGAALTVEAVPREIAESAMVAVTLVDADHSAARPTGRGGDTRHAARRGGASRMSRRPWTPRRRAC